MTQPKHDVDKLVREHLDAQANTVDGEAMRARVRATTLATPAPTRRTWLKWAGLGVGATVAAGIYLAMGGEGPIPVRTVSAAELVEQAKVEHTKALDRKYKLEVDIQPPMDAPGRPPFAGAPLAPPLLRDATLWTRGNVFFIESTGQFGRNWIWGRNAAGKIWISSDRKLGTTFDPDETTEPVVRTCEMMGVRMPAILQQLVDEAELTQESTSNANGPIRVTGTFRSGPAVLGARTISLWIDRDTKVISKMVIERLFRDRPVTTFTFTLLETGTLDENLYDLPAHLDKNGRVLPREAPLRKRILEDLINRVAPKPPPLPPRAKL